MGDVAVNATFLPHADENGPVDQKLHMHHGATGLDSRLPVTLGEWNQLRVHARANQRSQFETIIKTLALPGGWGPKRLDAAWNSAVQNWADGSTHG
ncbi:MAG: hypothetical protein AAGA48_28650 [Myxococcota bacterium]